MTSIAAQAPRGATSGANSGRGFSLTASGTSPEPVRAAAPVPMRSYEVVALRKDGSLYIGQDRAPAVPLLEKAFSAFARGTLIQTVDGPVAVEDLQPGDMINTSTGEPAKLIWVGSSSFVPADVGRTTPLLRIMTDSFGQGRPSTFLTVGPSARILHTPHHLRGDNDGTKLLTPVREFIDGVNVIEVTPPTPVRLFHICLTRHAAINAGGVEMETFHPGANATRDVPHSIRDRFLSLFPQIGHVTDFGPLAHPRAPEQEQDAF
ncbi:Hint domain-containing protein [Sulfitobacter brevis]|uniref:Hint domain-containing protein n=1 Tax=Sulfitobacter brevis TaxID=74348 RepID=A0A1I1T0G7_9RHOB|nr:Hint domain-containing protein [Sulfitobacter brevis]SFD52126.1 Hint domain-containing protein [Sulfitobacter brevis]